MDINQLNNLQTGATGVSGTGITPTPPTSPTDGAGSFKDVLMKNLSEVNQMQQDADKSMENFISGKSQNMGEVMAATQKANMAFSMLTQIRNKLQDAYDEVKNLRV